MGEKFGRWEVLEEGTSRFSKNGKKIKYCICKCQCGTVREVQLNSLKQEYGWHIEDAFTKEVKQ